MTTSPDFTNATNSLNRAITYDGDNMPTRIVHANGAIVDFVYDGVGKRTKKLVQSGKTVLYLGDHFEVENGVNIKYIFGGNLRLAQIKGSLTNSSISYFHKDHLGSTAAVTNEAGLKKESTTYEPFGSTRTQEGTPVSSYKFTDQELDNETNLYNYDARLYDPVIGMFVTPDSIVPNMFDPQNLNRYAYCRNNPLIYVDPSGHHPRDEMGNPCEGDRFGKGRSNAMDNKNNELNLQKQIQNKLKAISFISRFKTKTEDTQKTQNVINTLKESILKGGKINVSDLLGMLGLTTEQINVVNQRGQVSINKTSDNTATFSNSGQKIDVEVETDIGSITVEIDKVLSGDITVTNNAFAIENINGLKASLGILGSSTVNAVLGSTSPPAQVGVDIGKKRGIYETK